MRFLGRATVTGLLAGALACSSGATEKKHDSATAEDAGAGPDAGDKAFERVCTRFNPLKDAYFGDLHSHTALSLDANLQGTRLRPVEAYRFAKGERVGLPPYVGDKPGRTLQLERPLDFVALSDHAEFLGVVNTCLTPKAKGYDSVACVSYRETPDLAFTSLNAAVAVTQGGAKPPDPPCNAANAYCANAAKVSWQEVRSAAAQQNDTSPRCTFSTFVAYEWSASPGLMNLHRNVIFADEHVPELPFSYFDGNQEQDLWAALQRDCIDAKSGCDVLTIPHNSNLSSGLMFEQLDRADKPIDASYAKQRASFEPLVEMIQHKGSSECLPELGSDEQCNFELMPYESLLTVTLGGPPDVHQVSDYVRHALGQGLLLRQKLGENPFAYGFVGGTDTHLGVPGAVDEWAFQGHGGAGSSARTDAPAGLVDHIWVNPGGLSVLWAEQNSRDSLFAAMKRREAYATSGPRILLRFFGGYGYPANLCGTKDFVEEGYARGVPMGGDLPKSTNGQAPTFAVWAMRDAGTAAHPGVPLASVQIIKGWLEGGKVQYRVHNAIQTEHVGAGVDANCEPTGKGADELCAVWRDPEFKANQPAFYYARVLQNPSCRWHTYTCRKHKVDCSKPDAVPDDLKGCCEDYPETQQERAWSSPVFYQP